MAEAADLRFPSARRKRAAGGQKNHFTALFRTFGKQRLAPKHGKIYIERMILVYTGNGKGKTSASVGQAIRAHGQGLRVGFCQFMKRPDQAGEQTVLRSLLRESFYAGGKGFFRKEETREQHRSAALLVLAKARSLLADLDLLVLDESLYALGSGLLEQAELQGIMAEARAAEVHLVLSGRGLPDWLKAEADLITHMDELKHPHAAGQTAQRGIEY